MLQLLSKQTGPGAIHLDINTFENRLCCSSKSWVNKKPSQSVRCVFQSRPSWNCALVPPPRQSGGSPPRGSSWPVLGGASFCTWQPPGLSAEMADDANAMKPVHTWRQSYFRNPKHTHKITQLKISLFLLPPVRTGTAAFSFELLVSLLCFFCTVNRSGRPD